MTDTNRWRTIEQLFQEAVDLDPAARESYLESRGSDKAIRDEVEALIAAHFNSGEFIETPAYSETGWFGDGVTVPLSEEEHEQLVDRRMGPYKLIRAIGYGGMGAVYLASRDDDEFQKQVAIKLLKRGMDSDFIVRRFRNERQILASLDHPNIARLLDGGTTKDGLPYFVMEYIEGEPLTRYCDSQTLSTVDRLALFIKVCSAVHYAHQNLVIHRDIKPANILVTADGVPKLLDFGIAKLLNPDPSPQTVDLTAVSMRLMTPEYASPEQVRGEPITTASDVYSLGVLLYELVTGHRPYRITGRSQLDLVRIICEEEPEKPSTVVVRNDTAPARDQVTAIGISAESVSKNRDSQPDKLRRKLKGDIDNIVLMAMRKEPQRRYSSADQLASDIKRHLDGLPVIARKDTLGYRSAKFIKRNRVGVLAALLILATLIAGVVSTMTQRAKAEHRFNDVRKLANSFMFEVHDAIEDLPGSTAARELLVKRALEYLDSLARESSGDTSLQRELATSYQKVGDVQGRPANANLGNPEGAMESYKKALVIREALVAADPRSVQDRRQLAISHSRIADILNHTGDQHGAMEEYKRALAIREELYAADANDTRSRRDLAISYFEIGEALSHLEDFTGALESRRKMLPIFESLMAADPSSENDRRNVALSYKKLGGNLARLEQFDESLTYYKKALDMDEAALSADPTNATKRIDLSYSVSDYGYVLAQSGKPAQALESYRRALQIREELVAADPKDERARSSLATTYAKLGWVMSTMGDLTSSVDHFRKSIAIREAMIVANPGNVPNRADLGGLFAEVGDAFALAAEATGTPANKRTEHLHEARSWYQHSLDFLADLAREKGEQAVSASFAANTRTKIARCDEALRKK